MGAQFETVEQGAQMHGVNVDKLLADIKAMAEKKEA
jgi:hypothetical protein